MSEVDSNPHIVEFRAGKMTREGTTVSPDNRKGIVYLTREDDLVHLCWKEYGSSVAEDVS